MSASNAIVGALLRSPLHRVLSGSTDLIRYEGPRSGRTIVTPTQYARSGDDLVILVGRSEAKSWWRTFRTPHDLDVLVAGTWLAMTGEAVVGADDPERVGPLLDAYLRRFPKAAKTLGDGDRADRARRAVVVVCRPRSEP